MDQHVNDLCLMGHLGGLAIVSFLAVMLALPAGPMSRSVSKLRLSLASPPVRWKAVGKPPKSVFK